MDPLSKQTLIMEKIAQILHDEAGHKYEQVKGEFHFSIDCDDSAAITLFILDEGQSLNPAISDENVFEASDLAVELRNAMKAHTGGEWESFTLTLDKEGKANAKFYYPKNHKHLPSA